MSSSDQNRIAYNKIADAWAKCRDQSSVSQLIVEFAAHIKPHGHILDIGCGTGFPNATYLSSHGFTITGIDITENLLQKAIDRNIPNTTFHLCDFFDFRPDKKYDGILAFDSFFHFPKHRQADVYRHISPWMHPGAYLLFTHGNKEGEITGDMFDKTFYYSCLKTETVHQLLQETGFDIVWSKEGYEEYDIDRDLVILARKKA